MTVAERIYKSKSPCKSFSAITEAIFIERIFDLVSDGVQIWRHVFIDASVLVERVYFCGSFNDTLWSVEK